MCEKLFKHVGEFREHATQNMMEIVDDFHIPDKKEFGSKNMRKELFKDNKVIANQLVYLDEEDGALYYSAPQT